LLKQAVWVKQRLLGLLAKSATNENKAVPCFRGRTEGLGRAATTIAATDRNSGNNHLNCYKK